MTIHVVGHANPDTDSVTSAIALAAFCNAQGQEAKACMQIAAADLNPESTTVLKRFGLEAPEFLDNAADKKIALVDFSDLAQGPAGLDSADVVAVVDHHKIGDVTTNSPILFSAEPVGCTGTILNKMFKEAGIAIPKDVAGGMLSAILSDTVNFKSPTCTEDDKVAVANLKSIAGVDDTDELFMEMLKAKSASTISFELTKLSDLACRNIRQCARSKYRSTAIGSSIVTPRTATSRPVTYPTGRRSNMGCRVGRVAWGCQAKTTARSPKGRIGQTCAAVLPAAPI